MKRFSRRGFREWLAARPTQRFVARDPRSCPLAGYLRTLHPEATQAAATAHLSWKHGKVWVYQRAPLWAVRFMGRVDRRGDTVTGRTALKLLDALPR